MKFSTMAAIFFIFANLLLIGMIACDIEDDCDECDECDCSDGTGGGDDDVDSNGTNDCGDLNAKCLAWYDSCWGSEYSTVADQFCSTYLTLLDQYWDGSDSCVKQAQCDFFDCLIQDVTGCTTNDPSVTQAAIDACFNTYQTTAQACP